MAVLTKASRQLFARTPDESVPDFGTLLDRCWEQRNRSRDRWRRAISIRYCGDDARYCFRPGAPRKPHHAEVREGDALDHARCPVVWRARDT